MYTQQYIFLTTLLLLNSIQMLRGAAGTLDTSYGPNGTGISTVAVGRSNSLSSIAVNTDNSLVGVGTVTVTMTTSGACSFTSTGTLNIGFAAVGYAEFLIGSQTLLQSVALQSDAKIVGGGYTVINRVTQCIVARFNTNGSLDTGFGSTGYVTTDIRSGSSINAVLIQPSDGKILAGGVAGQGAPGCVLIRYNTDGTLDSTFGSNGVTSINVGYTSAINALAIQTDGKIVAAGFAWNYATNECILMRFNTDGSLDQTFGTGGITTTQFGFTSQTTAVAIGADGTIVLGGYTTNDSIHYLCALARYTASGTLDTTFNNTGIVTTMINYSSRINALAIQSDGKIVAGGYDFGARTTNFALIRYLTSGALDTGFGTNGIALTVIGSNAQINSLIIQGDGKIIAAGFSDDSAMLARYFA